MVQLAVGVRGASLDLGVEAAGVGARATSPTRAGGDGRFGVGAAGRPPLRFCQIERHVHDHVFLAAHQLAPADLHQDLASINAVALGGFFGVA